MQGLGVLLLLAVLGGAAGWWYAVGGSRPVLSDDTPAPVVASGPALPYTPPEKVKSDSELEPLATGLATHDEFLGPVAAGGIRVPIPNGWTRLNISPGEESRWVPPGNPKGSYSVRVQLRDDRRSLPQMVAERAAALPFDQRLSDLDITEAGGDTLSATFILDGYRRLTIVRWISFDGTEVDVEIAATGRLIDETGMEALLARMATQVRRVSPPAPTATASPNGVVS